MFDAAVTMSDSEMVLADREYEPVEQQRDTFSEALADDHFRTFVVRLGKSSVHIQAQWQELPNWLTDVIQGMNRVAALNPNWDSYGARPVNQRTLEYAFEVIMKFQGENPTLRVPQIGATVTGGVEFEWHGGGRDLEIQIEAPYRISAFFEDEHTSEDWEGPVGPELAEIQEYLGRISE